MNKIKSIKLFSALVFTMIVSTGLSACGQKPVGVADGYYQGTLDDVSAPLVAVQTENGNKSTFAFVTNECGSWWGRGITVDRYDIAQDPTLTTGTMTLTKATADTTVCTSVGTIEETGSDQSIKVTVVVNDANGQLSSRKEFMLNRVSKDDFQKAFGMSAGYTLNDTSPKFSEAQEQSCQAIFGKSCAESI